MHHVKNVSAGASHREIEPSPSYEFCDRACCSLVVWSVVAEVGRIGRVVQENYLRLSLTESACCQSLDSVTNFKPRAQLGLAVDAQVEPGTRCLTVCCAIRRGDTDSTARVCRGRGACALCRCHDDSLIVAERPMIQFGTKGECDVTVTRDSTVYPRLGSVAGCHRLLLHPLEWIRE